MSQTSALVAPATRPQFKGDSGVVTIPATGNTILLTAVLQNVINVLGVELTVAVHSIDGFLVEAQFHPSGDWVTITNAVTVTPAGLVLAASGTLASQAVGNGWLIMNTSGIYAVRFSASGSTDDTTTARILASGS